VDLDILLELCFMTNGHKQLNAEDFDDEDRERSAPKGKQAVLMGGLSYTKTKAYELDLPKDEDGI